MNRLSLVRNVSKNLVQWPVWEDLEDRLGGLTAWLRDQWGETWLLQRVTGFGSNQGAAHWYPWNYRRAESFGRFGHARRKWSWFPQQKHSLAWKRLSRLSTGSWDCSIGMGLEGGSGGDREEVVADVFTGDGKTGVETGKDWNSFL